MIAALQETKLTSKSKIPNIPQYTLLRSDRERNKGGGLAFIIHENILFKPLLYPPIDNHMEYLGIEIDNIKIINIYIPPSSSCDNDYNPDISRIIPTEDCIILGDFNAHDQLWYSPLQPEERPYQR